MWKSWRTIGVPLQWGWVRGGCYENVLTYNTYPHYAVFLFGEGSGRSRTRGPDHVLGQCVNREKSSIFFSQSTPQPVRVAVKMLLGVQVEAFSERYLGLPTAVGRITSGTFDHIGERSCSKMQGWSERLLACAGRETLLKSVIQAIPTYSMGCFLLIKKLCKRFDILHGQIMVG